MKKWMFWLTCLSALLGANAHAEVELDVAYSLDFEMNAECTGHVTVTNPTDEPIEGWQVEFDLPKSVYLGSLWNGEYCTSDSHLEGKKGPCQRVVVTHQAWNAEIPPGESVMFGFHIHHPENQPPTLSGFAGLGGKDPISDAMAATQYPLGASYAIDSSWGSGYQATVKLTNPSNAPTTSWTATFTLPAGQKISSLWNGTYKVSGQQITVSNPSWSGGGVIPAGGSTTFGLVVYGSGSPALSSLQAVAGGSVVPPVNVPAAPIVNTISVNPATPGNYTVSWSASQGASSYTLEQSSSVTFSNSTVIASGAALSYGFTNQPTGNYYYRVAAKNSAGTSPYSNIVNVAINNPPVQLSAPALQPISNSSGSGQYNVVWNSVAGAQGYTLQESSNASFSSASTVYSGSSTSFQVSGKSTGTYYYRAIAYAGSSQSTPSNVVTTTVTVPTTTSAVVEGYWESWNSSPSISVIAAMKADVIDISFGTFTRTATGFQVTGIDASQATVAQLVSAAHALGKKVKLSIGGATFGLSGMLLTTQDATAMAAAVAAYVQQNNLDGVDYDIEDYPAAALQITMIQSTRQLLGSGALISYTPKTPASTTAPYDAVIKGAHPYLTSISLMAYDYGPGYTYQGDVSALRAAGVPAAKILVGLMPGRDDLNILTSVANIQTAANYVKQNGLGGIMFWDLNRDHLNTTGLGVDAATNAAWSILH